MATKRSESKSARVRTLLSQGVAPADIAKQVGCTLGLVYNVKSRLGGSKSGNGRRRGAPGKRGPGRPRKDAGDLGNLDNIVAVVRQGEQQRSQLRAALQRIQQIVNDTLRG